MTRIRNAPQLITYPDSLGGGLRAVGDLLEGPLAGCFGGVHVLPPFPSSGDRGFAPIDYRRIDPAFGGWKDLERIGVRLDLGLDLIVNHVSRRSAEFRDFERRGRPSAFADMFLTLDKIWPGEPVPDDLARIFRRRPSPFSSYLIEETGEVERMWTTFGADDPSEQVDVDVGSPLTRRMLAEQLAFFAARGVRLVRLDAVGYAIKRAGTTCFMVEPEIHEFLAWLRSVAEPLELELLTEVHGDVATQRRLATAGQWSYDFALPGLVLHAILAGTADRLVTHLLGAPSRLITNLDSHDGIPIQPDLHGALSLDEARVVVDACLAAGGNLSRVVSRDNLPDPEFDAHQANCTYFAALGRDDEAYLLARAIQLFAPGIPQVYYVGLLAGDNDATALAEAGERRAVNRHDFAADEIAAALGRPVVRRFLELLRLRRDHAAFGGTLGISGSGAMLRLGWRADGARCSLEADLASGRWDVSAS